jgi:uroporphyrinogen-III synthase
MPSTGGPLDGRSVVVTRSREQASTLVAALSALGATTVELPVIATADPADGGDALAAAATRLAAGAYRWVAVTSTNAAARTLAALAGRPVPDGLHWAAVGTATAGALRDAGLRVDLVPVTATGAGLAGAFPAPGHPGDAVLLPRAETVGGDLADGLRARGWEVDEVVAYRTVAGAPDPARVAAARAADAVVFTSSSTVDRTIGLLGRGGMPPVVATIGPVTSSSARAAGLRVAAEAGEPTIEGLVAAVVAALDGDRPPRPRP